MGAFERVDAMKRALLTAGMALFAAGCGNDPVVTTLAEARAICDDTWPSMDEGWTAFVISLQALRDHGVSKSTAIGMVLDVCDAYPIERQTDCFTCLAAMIDAVWADR